MVSFILVVSEISCFSSAQLFRSMQSPMSWSGVRHETKVKYEKLAIYGIKGNRSQF